MNKLNIELVVQESEKVPNDKAFLYLNHKTYTRIKKYNEQCTTKYSIVTTDKSQIEAINKAATAYKRKLLREKRLLILNIQPNSTPLTQVEIESKVESFFLGYCKALGYK